jgi:transmembrane sensor
MNPSSPSDRAGPPSAAAALEDTAIAWLTERTDGFSPAREHAFAQWLKADPRHAATVARLEQTLGLLEDLPEFRAEINTAFDRTAPVVPFAAVAAPPARRRPRVVAWVGLAAALVLGLGIGWRTLRAPDETRYATTVSGYERARLDDGSTLELNAASAVRVQFTGAERRVKLDAGEAHFAVAHDTARPFIVSAGRVAVRAVGTAFNVRYAAGGDIEVTVTEGKVAVSGVERVDPNALATAIFVTAGQRIVLPKNAPLPAVEQVDPAALRAALAWQSRLADFAEAPLADVIARFNARSRIRLFLADEKLADRRIGGTFALDEAEAFVRLLERDGEIVAERRSENEIHLRRAR